MGFVYLIAAQGVNRVKIGFSADPAGRLISLQTGSPVELVLITTWPASTRDEQALHQLLAAARTHLEWFALSPEEAKYQVDLYFSKPDAPPRGSALLVETALTYARKIESAEALEQAREFAGVVVDQLLEVKAKIERQKAVKS